MNRGMSLVLGIAIGILIYHLLSPSFFAPSVTPIFSPEDGAKIISFVDSAQKSIDIEIYTFSSRDVVEALERARGRGVLVRIIIEPNVIGGENSQIYHELLSKGYSIRYASQSFKLTHAKFIIIDRISVLVGSHNLSNSALYKNREASVIIKNSPSVGDFIRVFENDWLIAD